MLKDVPRTQAYQNAILGNRQLFQGKVVMDIGAGTGKYCTTLLTLHLSIQNSIVLH